MGSALGGGAADQVFGGGSAAVLTKWTVWCVLGFFLIAFGLYLINQSNAGPKPEAEPNELTPQAPPANQGGNASSSKPPLEIPKAGTPLPPLTPEVNPPSPDANATELKAPAKPGPEGGE